MSLFGTSTPTSTNLFGSTPAAGSTPLFGSTTTTTPATGTPSLFGTPTTTPATGTPSLFGTPAVTTTTPAAGTTSLFGATTTTPTAATGTPSLFGAPTPTAGTSSIFGGSPATPPPSSGSAFSFGPTTTSLSTPTKTEPMGMSSSFITTIVQMNEELGNKASAQYALNAFVYDRSNVPQSKLDRNAAYPPAFLNAMKNNPDPDHLIPQPIQGFDGLAARVEEQKKKAEENKKALQDAERYMENVERDITKVVESVLPTLLTTYRNLSTELLKTIVTIRAYAGGAYINADERIIQAKLEDIESVASDPAKVGARLDALVEEVRSIASTRDPLSSSGIDNNSNISRADIEIFARHLEQEQKALKTLIENIRKCEQFLAQSHNRL